MIFSKVKTRSDTLGAVFSTLCLIHCIATPFIFVAQASTSGHHGESPFWWGIIDFVFLVLSFLAVYQSSKTTSKKWVKYLFLITWTVLALVILNEKAGLIPITCAAIYVPAFGLVALHLYNQKFCTCSNEACHRKGR